MGLRASRPKILCRKSNGAELIIGFCRMFIPGFNSNCLISALIEGLRRKRNENRLVEHVGDAEAHSSFICFEY